MLQVEFSAKRPTSTADPDCLESFDDQTLLEQNDHYQGNDLTKAYRKTIIKISKVPIKWDMPATIKTYV